MKIEINTKELKNLFADILKKNELPLENVEKALNSLDEFIINQRKGNWFLVLEDLDMSKVMHFFYDYNSAVKFANSRLRTVYHGFAQIKLHDPE